MRRGPGLRQAAGDCWGIGVKITLKVTMRFTKQRTEGALPWCMGAWIPDVWISGKQSVTLVPGTQEQRLGRCQLGHHREMPGLD